MSAIPPLRVVLAADLRRAVDLTYMHEAATPSRSKMLRAAIEKQEVWAVIEYRLRRAAVHNAPKPLRPVLKAVTWFTRHLMEIITGVYLPTRADIGPGLVLLHIGPVIVHGDFKAGSNFTLGHQTTIGALHDLVPTAGDCVFVGPGARVLGPVHLGDRSLVGANAVVTKSVPADHVAHGPAAVNKPDGHAPLLKGSTRP